MVPLPHTDVRFIQHQVVETFTLPRIGDGRLHHLDGDISGAVDAFVAEDEALLNP
ncbi:hypothetical protein D3C71_1913280 [compost metagenome]